MEILSDCRLRYYLIYVLGPTSVYERGELDIINIIDNNAHEFILSDVMPSCKFCKLTLTACMKENDLSFCYGKKALIYWKEYSKDNWLFKINGYEIDSKGYLCTRTYYKFVPLKFNNDLINVKIYKNFNKLFGTKRFPLCAEIKNLIKNYDWNSLNK